MTYSDMTLSQIADDLYATKINTESSVSEALGEVRSVLAQARRTLAFVRNALLITFGTLIVIAAAAALALIM